jgi:hypothetical protein
MADKMQQERATNTSLTGPAEDRDGRPADLREPEAFGPVNIRETIRPNPPEDRGPHPEMAKPGDPLPRPRQTSRWQG